MSDDDNPFAGIDPKDIPPGLVDAVHQQIVAKKGDIITSPQAIAQLIASLGGNNPYAGTGTSNQTPAEYVPSTKALEYLINHAADNRGLKNPKEVTDYLHSASMISFVKAVSHVMADDGLPCSFYLMGYDPANHSVEFEELGGEGQIHMKNRIEIDEVDLIMAAAVRDKMPLLFEGDTGLGKTYRVSAFMKTVLDPDNHRVLRLGRTNSNPQQPYVRGEIENGVLKVYLRKEALREIGIIMVDEANRSDSDKMLQTLDGEVHLASGERGELGLFVPQVVEVLGTDGKPAGEYTVELSEDFLKKVAIYLAQNPPRSDDPRYTQTTRADGAQANRCQKVRMPNYNPYVTSSVDVFSEMNHQHERFMKLYIENMVNLLGIDQEKFEELLLGPEFEREKPDKNYKAEWLSLYAFTTDSRKTKKETLFSARELSDFVIFLLGSEDDKTSSPDKCFKREQKMLKNVTDALVAEGYSVDFNYDPGFDHTSAEMQKVAAVANAIEGSIYIRDSRTRVNVAHLLATINDYRKALSESDPVSAFQSRRESVSIEEMASALAIMLKHRVQKSSTEDPLDVVNKTIIDYKDLFEKYSVGLHEKLYGEAPDETPVFDIYDPSVGIRNLAMYSAISSVVDFGKEIPSRSYAMKMIDSLNASADVLKNLHDGKDSKMAMIARSITDMAVAASFIDTYKDEITRRFNECSATEHSERTKQYFNIMGDVLAEVRRDRNAPKAYAQRLTRVFGK